MFWLSMESAAFSGIRGPEPTDAMTDVTHILQPAERLLPVVYQEMRTLAAARMARECADHTLQPAALVHEAWLRLAGKDERIPFANRAHFFGAAAEAMRRILIDRARRRSACKRGRDFKRMEG
jgi:RNA polymerase sigma factor (TIGR02999 family)